MSEKGGKGPEETGSEVEGRTSFETALGELHDQHEKMTREAAASLTFGLSDREDAAARARAAEAARKAIDGEPGLGDAELEPELPPEPGLETGVDEAQELPERPHTAVSVVESSNGEQPPESKFRDWDNKTLLYQLLLLQRHGENAREDADNADNTPVENWHNRFVDQYQKEADEIQEILRERGVLHGEKIFAREKNGTILSVPVEGLSEEVLDVLRDEDKEIRRVLQEKVVEKTNKRKQRLLLMGKEPSEREQKRPEQVQTHPEKEIDPEVREAVDGILASLTENLESRGANRVIIDEANLLPEDVRFEVVTLLGEILDVGHEPIKEYTKQGQLEEWNPLKRMFKGDPSLRVNSNPKDRLKMSIYTVNDLEGVGDGYAGMERNVVWVAMRNQNGELLDVWIEKTGKPAYKEDEKSGEYTLSKELRKRLGDAQAMVGQSTGGVGSGRVGGEHQQYMEGLQRRAFGSGETMSPDAELAALEREEAERARRPGLLDQPGYGEPVRPPERKVPERKPASEKIIEPPEEFQQKLGEIRDMTDPISQHEAYNQLLMWAENKGSLALNGDKWEARPDSDGEAIISEIKRGLDILYDMRVQSLPYAKDGREAVEAAKEIARMMAGDRMARAGDGGLGMEVDPEYQELIGRIKDALEGKGVDIEDLRLLEADYRPGGFRESGHLWKMPEPDGDKSGKDEVKVETPPRPDIETNFTRLVDRAHRNDNWRGMPYNPAELSLNDITYLASVAENEQELRYIQEELGIRGKLEDLDPEKKENKPKADIIVVLQRRLTELRGGSPDDGGAEPAPDGGGPAPGTGGAGPGSRAPDSPEASVGNGNNGDASDVQAGYERALGRSSGTPSVGTSGTRASAPSPTQATGGDRGAEEGDDPERYNRLLEEYTEGLYRIMRISDEDRAIAAWHSMLDEAVRDGFVAPDTGSPMGVRSVEGMPQSARFVDGLNIVANDPSNAPRRDRLKYGRSTPDSGGPTPEPDDGMAADASSGAGQGDSAPDVVGGESYAGRSAESDTGAGSQDVSVLGTESGESTGFSELVGRSRRNDIAPSGELTIDQLRDLAGVVRSEEDLDDLYAELQRRHNFEFEQGGRQRPRNAYEAALLSVLDDKARELKDKRGVERRGGSREGSKPRRRPAGGEENS